MGRQWGVLVVAIIAIIASRVTASSPGEVRVRRLAQGHLDTPLAGAGDRTSEPSGYQQTRSISSATVTPPLLAYGHVWPFQSLYLHQQGVRAVLWLLVSVPSSSSLVV